MDFTRTTYKRLLTALKSSKYGFQTLNDFIQVAKQKTIILRHDVDRLPSNALKFARLENERGIGATYYFRAVPESWDEGVIRELASLGHEIGYHYENLSEINGLAQRRKGAKKDKRTGNRIEEKENRKENPQITPVPSSGATGQAQINADEKNGGGKGKLFELAIEDFERNLEKLRKFYPVKTICMHGSPLSKWDNRDLWKKYDYRDFGIVGEPYFDLDFDEVFYLTDTGRRWDGDRVNVRDKVFRGEDKRVSGLENEKVRNRNILAQRRRGAKNRQQNVGIKELETKKRGRSFDNLRFRSTFDIIEAAEKGLLPDKMMINTHPQRWTDNPVEWMKELVWQNFKNVIKRTMLAYRDKN